MINLKRNYFKFKLFVHPHIIYLLNLRFIMEEQKQ